jgi:putative ABC transport system permease protein
MFARGKPLIGQLVWVPKLVARALPFLLACLAAGCSSDPGPRREVPPPTQSEGRPAERGDTAIPGGDIIVRSVRPAGAKERAEEAEVRSYGLTAEDMERIRATVPAVREVIPVRIVRAEIRQGGRAVQGRIVGTTAAFADAARLRNEKGRFLADTDERVSADVCAISAGLAAELFREKDPLGSSLTLGGHPFRVIGVFQLPPDGPEEGAGEGAAGDLEACIPLSTSQKKFEDAEAGARVEIHQILIRLKPGERVPATGPAIRSLLQRFHREDDYEVTIPVKVLDSGQGPHQKAAADSYLRHKK